jgi:Hint domain
VDGKLIPAKLLINHMTIVQERDVAAVHYYHVELDQHSVMFAEGLPAESYLDTGNRAMFANAGLAMILHPEFEINAHLRCWQTDACAPLTIGQEAVKPIWDNLVERAESLGYQRVELTAAVTTEPDLRLVADGRVLRPLSSDAGRYVFVVPAGVSSVRLASRSSVPSDFAAYLDDWRNLGVSVRRIVVRDSSGLIELPPDHPGLTAGWHRLESDATTMWRWTNGDAVLPIGPTAGPTMVEIHTAAARYILEDAAQVRLAA